LTRRLWATVLLSVKLEIKAVSSLISTMGITNPRRGTDCTHLVLTSPNVPERPKVSLGFRGALASVPPSLGTRGRAARRG
jgi:hypothetical protein